MNDKNFKRKICGFICFFMIFNICLNYCNDLIDFGINFTNKKISSFCKQLKESSFSDIVFRKEVKASSAGITMGGKYDVYDYVDTIEIDTSLVVNIDEIENPYTRVDALSLFYLQGYTRSYDFDLSAVNPMGFGEYYMADLIEEQYKFSDVSKLDIKAIANGSNEYISAIGWLYDNGYIHISDAIQKYNKSGDKIEIEPVFYSEEWKSRYGDFDFVVNRSDFIRDLMKVADGTIQSRPIVFRIGDKTCVRMLANEYYTVQYESAEKYPYPNLLNTFDYFSNQIIVDHTRFGTLGLYASPNVYELYFSKALSSGIISKNEFNNDLGQIFLEDYDDLINCYNGEELEFPAWINYGDVYYAMGEPVKSSELSDSSEYRRALIENYKNKGYLIIDGVNEQDDLGFVGSIIPTKDSKYVLGYSYSEIEKNNGEIVRNINSGYFEHENMTLLDGLIYVYKSMCAFGEPQLTNVEVDQLSMIYDIKLNKLSDYEAYIIKYLIAKGIIDGETFDYINLFKELTMEDAYILLYRYANPDARYTFKQIQAILDLNMYEKGFVKSTTTYSKVESLFNVYDLQNDFVNYENIDTISSNNYDYLIFQYPRNKIKLFDSVGSNLKFYLCEYDTDDYSKSTKEISYEQGFVEKDIVFGDRYIYQIYVLEKNSDTSKFILNSFDGNEIPEFLSKNNVRDVDSGIEINNIYKITDTGENWWKLSENNLCTLNDNDSEDYDKLRNRFIEILVKYRDKETAQEIGGSIFESFDLKIAKNQINFVKNIQYLANENDNSFSIILPKNEKGYAVISGTIDEDESGGKVELNSKEGIAKINNYLNTFNYEVDKIEEWQDTNWKDVSNQEESDNISVCKEICLTIKSTNENTNSSFNQWGLVNSVLQSIISCGDVLEEVELPTYTKLNYLTENGKKYSITMISEKILKDNFGINVEKKYVDESNPSNKNINKIIFTYEETEKAFLIGETMYIKNQIIHFPKEFVSVETIDDNGEVYLYNLELISSLINTAGDSANIYLDFDGVKFQHTKNIVKNVGTNYYAGFEFKTNNIGFICSNNSKNVLSLNSKKGYNSNGELIKDKYIRMFDSEYYCINDIDDANFIMTRNIYDDSKMTLINFIPYATKAQKDDFKEVNYNASSYFDNEKKYENIFTEFEYWLNNALINYALFDKQKIKDNLITKEDVTFFLEKEACYPNVIIFSKDNANIEKEFNNIVDYLAKIICLMYDNRDTKSGITNFDLNNIYKYYFNKSLSYENSELIEDEIRKIVKHYLIGYQPNYENFEKLENFSENVNKFKVIEIDNGSLNNFEYLRFDENEQIEVMKDGSFQNISPRNDLFKIVNNDCICIRAENDASLYELGFKISKSDSDYVIQKPMYYYGYGSQIPLEKADEYFKEIGDFKYNNKNVSLDCFYSVQKPQDEFDTSLSYVVGSKLTFNNAAINTQKTIGDLFKYSNNDKSYQTNILKAMSDIIKKDKVIEEFDFFDRKLRGNWNYYNLVGNSNNFNFDVSDFFYKMFEETNINEIKDDNFDIILKNSYNCEIACTFDNEDELWRFVNTNTQRSWCIDFSQKEYQIDEEFSQSHFCFIPQVLIPFGTCSVSVDKKIDFLTKENDDYQLKYGCESYTGYNGFFKVLEKELLKETEHCQTLEQFIESESVDIYKIKCNSNKMEFYLIINEELKSNIFKKNNVKICGIYKEEYENFEKDFEYLEFLNCFKEEKDIFSIIFRDTFKISEENLFEEVGSDIGNFIFKKDDKYIANKADGFLFEFEIDKNCFIKKEEVLSQDGNTPSLNEVEYEYYLYPSDNINIQNSKFSDYIKKQISNPIKIYNLYQNLTQFPDLEDNKLKQINQNNYKFTNKMWKIDVDFENIQKLFIAIIANLPLIFVSYFTILILLCIIYTSSRNSYFGRKISKLIHYISFKKLDKYNFDRPFVTYIGLLLGLSLSILLAQGSLTALISEIFNIVLIILKVFGMYFEKIIENLF